MKFVFFAGFHHSGKTRYRIDNNYRMLHISNFQYSYRSNIKDYPVVDHTFLDKSKYIKVSEFLEWKKFGEILKFFLKLKTDLKDLKKIFKYNSDIYCPLELVHIPLIFKGGYDLSDFEFEIFIRDFRIVLLLATIDETAGTPYFLFKKIKREHQLVYHYLEYFKIIKFEDYIIDRDIQYNKYFVEHDIKTINSNNVFVKKQNILKLETLLNKEGLLEYYGYDNKIDFLTLFEPINDRIKLKRKVLI